MSDFRGSFEKRYRDAQRRGDTAETRLTSRKIVSAELAELVARYDDVPEDHFLDPGLAEWRKEKARAS